VTLNVASQLDVPTDFAEGNRTVRLHGEAYFDVAHTGNQPFVVEAAGTKTRVLGTQFGIRAYRPDSVIVAVRTGKVAIGQTVLGASDIAYARRDARFNWRIRHWESVI
jgi:ferric-dicitrate binding protein FerR (iron transport regulator)